MEFRLIFDKEICKYRPSHFKIFFLFMIFILSNALTYNLSHSSIRHIRLMYLKWLPMNSPISAQIPHIRSSAYETLYQDFSGSSRYLISDMLDTAVYERFYQFYHNKLWWFSERSFLYSDLCLFIFITLAKILCPKLIVNRISDTWGANIVCRMYEKMSFIK